MEDEGSHHAEVAVSDIIANKRDPTPKSGVVPCIQIQCGNQHAASEVGMLIM